MNRMQLLEVSNRLTDFKVVPWMSGYVAAVQSSKNSLVKRQYTTKLHRHSRLIRHLSLINITTIVAEVYLIFKNIKLKSALVIPSGI